MGKYFLLIFIVAVPIILVIRAQRRASLATPTPVAQEQSRSLPQMPAREDGLGSGGDTSGNARATAARFPGIVKVPALDAQKKSAPYSASMPSAPALPLPIILPPISALSPVASSSSAPPLSLPNTESKSPPLPPLDEKAIFSAVVKIECPSEDRKGRYVASGFAMPHGVIVTAAHFIKDSGSDTCTVIFPRDRAPSIYLLGKTEDREQVRRRHDEQGIDVAFIFMPLLAAYPEARAVFPDAYPFIPYPICSSTALLGDAILHFGYPSSFQNNSYLDKSEGVAAAYADINGITQELSEDQSYLFKSPVFGYTSDQSQLHPYLIARSASFYGDSGGLGFDATRQCIVGPDRGGTIGGAAGENFSIFMVLGWDGARKILP